MFTNSLKSTRATYISGRNTHVVHSTVPRMRTHHKFISVIIASAMIAVFADISIAHAQTATSVDAPASTLAQAAPSGTKEGQGKPPREAIDACTSLPKNATCSFDGRDGKQLSGTCRAPKTDIPLACAPVEMPQKG